MLPSGYENIPLSEETPSIEDIRITEKTLKWCAVAKDTHIPDFDIIMILRRTTNILRYFINESILNLIYPPYHEGMCVLCIHYAKGLVIVDVGPKEIYEWENNCQQSFEVIRLANPQDKYLHVDIYGQPSKRNL